MGFLVSCSPKGFSRFINGHQSEASLLYGLGRLSLELENEEFCCGRGTRLQIHLQLVMELFLFVKKTKVLNCIKEQRGENTFACDSLIHLRGYKSQRSLKETAIHT